MRVFDKTVVVVVVVVVVVANRNALRTCVLSSLLSTPSKLSKFL